MILSACRSTLNDIWSSAGAGTSTLYRSSLGKKLAIIYSTSACSTSTPTFTHFVSDSPWKLILFNWKVSRATFSLHFSSCDRYSRSKAPGATACYYPDATPRDFAPKASSCITSIILSSLYPIGIKRKCRKRMARVQVHPLCRPPATALARRLMTPPHNL